MSKGAEKYREASEIGEEVLRGCSNDLDVFRQYGQAEMGYRRLPAIGCEDWVYGTNSDASGFLVSESELGLSDFWSRRTRGVRVSSIRPKGRVDVVTRKGKLGKNCRGCSVLKIMVQFQKLE